MVFMPSWMCPDGHERPRSWLQVRFSRYTGEGCLFNPYRNYPANDVRIYAVNESSGRVLPVVGLQRTVGSNAC